MPPFNFIAQPYPAHVEGRAVRKGETLSDLLERCEVLALTSARAPRAFVEGSPKMARLFPDHESVGHARPYHAAHRWSCRRAAVRRVFDRKGLALLEGIKRR